MGLAVGISSWDWLVERAAGDGSRTESLNRQMGIADMTDSLHGIRRGWAAGKDSWNWQLGEAAGIDIWISSWAAELIQTKEPWSWISLHHLPFPISPLSHPPPPPSHIPVFHVSIALGEGPGPLPQPIKMCAYTHTASMCIWRMEMSGEIDWNPIYSHLHE